MTNGLGKKRGYYMTGDKTPLYLHINMRVTSCGKYRHTRQVENGLKILERVVEEIIKIDDMQFCFMIGRETTDALLVVRQLQEKTIGRKQTFVLSIYGIWSRLAEEFQ